MSMIQVTSFLLGIGVAWALPAVSRVVRPVLVEAAVAGMALFDETRRAVAEQMETIEDIAAEARARRDDAFVAANGHHAAAGSADEEPRVERPRRRGDGPSRRRTG
jgi:hypothetical protein